MLNIYHGPEYIDKSRFIFEHISGRTLLLVPDQFSLQAEKDALYYLGTDSLMDLRVVDFSTLGHKVLQQVGGGRLPLIDKYGRHMLLTKIINEAGEELEIYRNLSWKNSFIDMMNTMISEMKRYGAVPEDISGAVESLEDSGFLKYKLTDIYRIFSRYEDAIEGKYLDSEDYMTFYGEKISQAPMVKESDVWIYGFDTFTPRNMQIIEKLLLTARSVNIVLAYDSDECFSLTSYIMESLRELAANAGVEAAVSEIDGVKRKTAAGRAAELSAAGNSGGAGGEMPVVLAELSNPYAEAERAASYIQKLVREHGYRYSDIVVVCNDLDGRGAVLRRILTRWGIPVFIDKKRKVTYHSAVVFLLSLMEIIAGGYRNEAVMRLLKSGVIRYDAEDAELLENYIAQYRTKAAMWKNGFVKGAEQYGEETFARIDALRGCISQVVEDARERVSRKKKAGEKIRGLYTFLEEDLELTKHLEEIMQDQIENDFAENAAETAQSWSVICRIFDQVAETVGEEQISNRELLTLLTAGFEEMEIGLVPVTPDSIVIGTLQRTRLSRIKVMLVVGANEGVLPMGREDEGLLSEREKAHLEEMGLEISKRSLISRKEESIAVYRTLYMPEERLYISCCKAGAEGENSRPSEVFMKFRDMCGDDILPDLDDESDIMDRITTRQGTLAPMAEALREYGDGEYIGKDWLRIMNWYGKNEPDSLAGVKNGLIFSSNTASIGEKLADALYRGDRQDLEVSASQLEKYSSCPFAHFIGYGLRPEELKAYEIGAREIGDIYHEALMIFSQGLNAGLGAGMEISDPGSPWMEISRDQCHDRIAKILKDDLAGYREGLMSAGRAEEYKTWRITEICDRIAWTMVEQVRKGAVSSMGFEVPFGKGRRLPEIHVDAGGRDVLIRGKIDRLDILEGPQPAVRVIDYKTGSDYIDLEHFRSGYKLQLMIYLRAGMQRGELKPAGVFYFRIHDTDINADNKKVVHGEEALNERIEESYKLQGIMLDDTGMINSMDIGFDGNSSVVPVKFSKTKGVFVPSPGSELLSEEEFRELSEEVDAQIKRICTEICGGSIAAEPKREKKRDMDGKVVTSCRYCRYRSICMFDTAFRGCRFRTV